MGEHIEVLVVGALRASGKRTVTAALRVTGLSQEGQLQKYPRVLLGLVGDAFVPAGPVGIDWHRRHLGTAAGAKIKAKGIYRVRCAPRVLIMVKDLCRTHRRVACQILPDLYCRDCAGQTGAVEFLPFCDVGAPLWDDNDPALALRALDRDRLLCRLIG